MPDIEKREAGYQEILTELYKLPPSALKFVRPLFKSKALAGAKEKFKRMVKENPAITVEELVNEFSCAPSFPVILEMLGLTENDFVELAQKAKRKAK